MKKHTRGFTVAEVVIAMAVIAVVTAAALSFFVSAQSTRKTVLATADARHFAEDARLSFRTAESEEEFLSHLTFAREGILFADGGLSHDGTHTYLYTSEKHGYTATLTVRYADAERSVFSIRVVRGESRELLTLSYEKGDA